jgi:hypothetical protein
MECTKCNIDKIESEFPFKNKELNKRNTVCKVCQREYKRQHYHNNKQAHYDRNRLTKQRLRNHVSEVREQGCVICNEKSKPCLEFHHLDPTQKEESVALLTSKGSINKVVLEISKCVLLCANCHRKIHHDLDNFIKEIIAS